MQSYQTKILSTGIYLPKRVVTNFDLQKTIETSDEWIFERTGIKTRRISDPNGGEFPSDMALYATRDALKTAGLEADAIDLILFASCTPDYKLPNTATILQTKLGIKRQCACVDISAACSGFVYGLSIADSLIRTGVMKTVLVVGAEMLSREVDWSDRGSCILFGDGCGVAIVGRAEANEKSQIHSVVLGADGTGKEFFKTDHGGAVSPLTPQIINEGRQYMQMQGKEMFKVAVRTLVDNGVKALEAAGKTLDDITWVVPHQANIRILEATADRLQCPMEKMIINIEKYGNTSAATVPIAFHEAISDGRIKRGDLLLFDVFGAGLTSGAMVLTY